MSADEPDIHLFGREENAHDEAVTVMPHVDDPAVTSYRLQSVFSLSSKYAKRIYQIASQWKDIGETKTFTLDEFKIMLSLKDPKGQDPKQYEKISALQKYVLDVATA